MKYVVILTILICTRGNTQVATEVEKEGLVQHREILSEIDISVCGEDKRDVDLYKEFIDVNSMTFATELGNRLYYNSSKEAFDRLFQSADIDCIVPLSGGKYLIYDMYYGDLRAEHVYDRIISVNEGMVDVNDYHDFFKRGLVFILDSESNKLTILVFNPFADNSLPRKIASYFKKNASKYERAVRIVGIGQVKILVE